METLVLSTSYQPMYKTSWKNAMSMWVAGRAEIISEYTDKFIRTTKQKFNIPSVIRFVSNVIKRWNYPVKFSKQNIYIRDDGRCGYCCQNVSVHKATFDHVIPKSKGGQTSWTNIVIACKECNQRKANKTVEEAGMKLRKYPTQPKTLFIKNNIDVIGEIPDDWKMYLGLK